MTTFERSSSEQTGADLVDAALDRVAHDAQRAIDIKHTTDDYAQLLAVQGIAAARYQAEILDPQRAIWGTTLAIVREDTPAALTMGKNTGWGYLRWNYKTLDPNRKQEINSQVKISFEPNPPEGPFPEGELRTAVGYLANGPSALPKKLPDSLLGVGTRGWLMWKHIPRAALLGAIVDTALPATQNIHVEVSATTVGTTAARSLFNVEVTRTKLGLDHYLLPEHVSSISADLKGGRWGGNTYGKAVPHPTPQDAEIFLDNQYFSGKGIDPAFEKLASINKLLAGSTLVVPNK